MYKGIRQPVDKMKKTISLAFPVLLLLCFLFSLAAAAQVPTAPAPHPFKSDQFAFSATFNAPVKQKTLTTPLSSGNQVTTNAFVATAEGSETSVQVETFAESLPEDQATQYLQAYLQGALGKDTVMVSSEEGTFGSYPSTRAITTVTLKDGTKLREEHVIIVVPERSSIYDATFTQEYGKPIDPSAAPFWASLSLLTPRAVAAGKQRK